MVEPSSRLIQAVPHRMVEIEACDGPLWAGPVLLLSCPADVIHMLLASATRRAHFQRSSALATRRHTSEQRLDRGLLTGSRSAELQLLIDFEPEFARDNRRVLARKGHAFVTDVSSIEDVGQEPIQARHSKQFATVVLPTCAHPTLCRPSAGAYRRQGFRPTRTAGAEREDRTDLLRFGFVHHQPPSFGCDIVSQDRNATDPLPF